MVLPAEFWGPPRAWSAGRSPLPGQRGALAQLGVGCGCRSRPSCRPVLQRAPGESLGGAKGCPAWGSVPRECLQRDRWSSPHPAFRHGRQPVASPSSPGLQGSTAVVLGSGAGPEQDFSSSSGPVRVQESRALVQAVVRQGLGVDAAGQTARGPPLAHVRPCSFVSEPGLSPLPGALLLRCVSTDVNEEFMTEGGGYMGPAHQAQAEGH